MARDRDSNAESRDGIAASKARQVADALYDMTGARLPGFGAEEPDGLLVHLAAAPGVERDISIDARPLRGNHGHVTVRWRQDGRQRSAEGSTLGVALRRSLRAARPVSASTDIEGRG